MEGECAGIMAKEHCRECWKQERHEDCELVSLSLPGKSCFGAAEPRPGLCLMGWMLPWNGLCASQPLQSPSVFAVGSLD